MTPETLSHQVESWLQYSRKGGSRGLSFWMDARGFTREERQQIMLALSDEEIR